MIRVPSTDGVELAVHDLGGDGPPLLLCHATGFHARVWEGVAAELADRRCLALDFRGFGDSTAPADETFEWRGFADDVLAVVDRFALTDVQAIGHSKGGAALLMAELARPGTFERLVCYEPIVFPVSDEAEGAGGGGNLLAEITRHRRTTFESFDEAVERFAAKAPLGALRPDVLSAYVHHGFRPTGDGRVTLKADREHDARTYEMGSRHGTFERLEAIRCPVLVAHGGGDDHPAAVAPLVAERLPHGELRAFPDLGHFGPLEDPRVFATAARRFLA